jgi:hypothetical protein
MQSINNTKDAQGLAMEKALQAKDRSGSHTEAFTYLRSSAFRHVVVVFFLYVAVVLRGHTFPTSRPIYK